jgi:hypothetical protein
MDDIINIGLLCLLMGVGVAVTVVIITIYLEFFLD